MLEIREVNTKKEKKEFIKFPINLYKDNEYFVPMIENGEWEIFKDSHPYNKVCDVCFYNAYLDGEIVGRIQGIIQREANKKWDQSRVRFTRFDCIDNQEVADGLFKAVESWAKDKGMTEFVGPLGYSDLEREGLLIEGFDQRQTYEEQYNYEYYARLIENHGFGKDTDWIECMLLPPKEKNERLISLSEKMLNRYGLKMVYFKTTKEFIKKYLDGFFEAIDICYSKLYGTMPLNEEITKSLVADFKLLVRPKDVTVIVDQNDKVVAFALMFPSISDVVRKSKGKITLPFLIRFLKAKKNAKVIDLGLIGVLPEYEMKGVASALIGALMNLMEENNIEHFETNLMLEDNAHIHNLIKHFNTVQNKRRRCYKINI